MDDNENDNDEIILLKDSENAMVIIKNGKFDKILAHKKEEVYNNADAIVESITTELKIHKAMKSGIWAFIFEDDFTNYFFDYIGK